MFEQRVELLYQVGAAPAQQLAILGESQRACRAVDQPRSQLLFELLQPLRDRRRRQPEFSGGGRETSTVLNHEQETNVGGVGHIGSFRFESRQD